MKRLLLLAISTLTLSSLLATPLFAANSADWQPGNIIDDSVFTNKNTMDATTIQNFLNAKVPTCDNWGTQPYAGTTRRAYSEARGEVFPLICLKDYYENPVTHENNLQGRPIPSGGLSAAQIISAAAQGWNVNPQVLIVFLQKEQGLVTDDWPWATQYRSAMGYGCPDSAPCDSQYYGFYNQMNMAARQFRIYADNPNSFNYVKGQNNNIQYSPNAACGTKSVYIMNQATASLYNYTPYTPNQAALNNLYGNGDSCSSYGNRNFWTYFIDWFGSPYANYSWQTISQNAYFDSTKTMQADLGKLGPGQRYYLTMVIKNTGNVVWTNSGAHPVNLGTFSPQDRASPFCDLTWIGGSPGCNRVSTMREAQVRPGEYASFEFYITTPNTPGNYNEVFAPVSEGAAWMNNATVSFPMIVQPAYYSGNILSQYAYTNSAKQQPMDTNHMVAGQRYYMGVTIKNTGNVAWYRDGANAMHLGTTNARDRSSPFCDTSTWASCNRSASLKESYVLPGQVGTFEYWVTTPTFGDYAETYAPVIEGKTWMDDLPITFYHKVEPYNYTVTALRIFTDNTKQVTADFKSLNPGQRYYVTMDLRNTGWANWTKLAPNPVALGTSGPRDRTSTFCDFSWLSCSRPAPLHEYTVNSGLVGSFEFWITAPQTPGWYVENFAPVVEGQAWMGEQNLSLGFNVNQPQYSWNIIVQYAYTDSSKSTPVNLSNLQAGQRFYLDTVVQNTGNTIWKKDGVNPMSIGTANPIDRTSPFCDNTWLGCNRPNVLHEWAVAPGQYGSFEFWAKAPNTTGNYNEIYAPVIEGKAWLNSHTISYPMTIH